MRQAHLPIEQLHAWAKLNGVDFYNTQVTHVVAEDGQEDRGSGLIASTDLHGGDGGADVLLSVPRELVLSRSRVEEYAKSDKDLREVLEAVAELARTARGAILIFLLMQVTISSPDIDQDAGMATPWTDYVKFLPSEITLPTFYSEAERDLLFGTSLADALDQKVRSLEREYDLLQNSTSNVSWCRKHWWDEETGKLSFSDWKQVDAMFRSRALDMPGAGHVMAPCIDMINHASGKETKALYEIDLHGNALLQLRPDKILKAGEEVTITYGDEKGASEMLFSYGFLESSLVSARQLFLDLDIPTDDPLRIVKKTVCEVAPGVRIYTQDNQWGWESDFIWWACINEEDGLDFRVLQRNDGEMELKVEWKGEEFAPATIHNILSRDSMWDVFQLRAIVMLQERIERQAVELQANEEDFEEATHPSGVRDQVWKTIRKLRTLEHDLFAESYGCLQNQRMGLLESDTVQSYLRSTDPYHAEDTEEDFS